MSLINLIINYDGVIGNKICCGKIATGAEEGMYIGRGGGYSVYIITNRTNGRLFYTYQFSANWTTVEITTKSIY